MDSFQIVFAACVVKSVITTQASACMSVLVAVLGAKINEYLLEKSRVARQEDGEENFHVFYYMFAGLSDSERQALHLTTANKYR